MSTPASSSTPVPSATKAPALSAGEPLSAYCRSVPPGAARSVPSFSISTPTVRLPLTVVVPPASTCRAIAAVDPGVVERVEARAGGAGHVQRAGVLDDARVVDDDPARRPGRRAVEPQRVAAGGRVQVERRRRSMSSTPALKRVLPGVLERAAAERRAAVADGQRARAAADAAVVEPQRAGGAGVVEEQLAAAAQLGDARPRSRRPPRRCWRRWRSGSSRTRSHWSRRP